MGGNTTLTILTPTYNRGNLLKTLYRSLCKQENKDFQWLVIDDGSTDDTRCVVEDFQKEKKIQIDYYHKPNGGKHTALNYAHPYIKGKYLVIVDSDDQLIPPVVGIILSCWETYQKNKEIAGITFQRGNLNSATRALDTSIKGEYISTLTKEMNRGMCGDHCETFRAERFVSHRFPEFPDERFIPEAAMWYLITKGSKIIYSDKVIYLCEYLPGGLTRSGRALHMKNANGCMWHASIFLDPDFNLKIRFKKAILVVCYGLNAGKSFQEMMDISHGHEWLLRLAYVPALILRKYWGG